MSPPPNTATTTAETTKQKLRRAARQVVCDEGLSGASARKIAACAGVNQALVFYHFSSVSELLEAASGEAIEASVEYYRSAFDDVTSINDLVRVARHLHEREHALGNVTFMAQMLSGAHHDPVVARATRFAMDAWSAEVRVALDRVLGDGPLAGLVDTAGLADLVCAGFIGIELFGSADPKGAERAIGVLEQIGGLIDLLGNLGSGGNPGNLGSGDPIG